MDHAPALEALATCRTYDEAVVAVGADALEAAIRANAWAVLAAPALWNLLDRYMQLRRLDDLEADLIRARAVVMGAIVSAEALTEEEGHVGRDTNSRRSRRTGTDVVAIGAQALTGNATAHVKVSREREAVLGTVRRAAAEVSFRLDEIRRGKLTPDEARDRVLLYLASTDPRLEVALAMARVWTFRPRVKRGEDYEALQLDGQPETVGMVEALPTLVSTLDQLRAARERALSAGDFGHVAQLTTTIDTAERQQRAEQATTEASGDGLLEAVAARVAAGAMG